MECTAADACHAVRDCDACQTATSVECIPADACPSGDNDLFQRFGNMIFIIRILRRAKEIAEMRFACAVRELSDKRDCYACQTAASGECSLIDDRHAVGNDNACQTTASQECITRDAGHAVRDNNACQTAASGECTTADACHAVGDDNACQTAASGECTTTDACHAVRERDAFQLLQPFQSIVCDFGDAVFDHNYTVFRNIGNMKIVGVIHEIGIGVVSSHIDLQPTVYIALIVDIRQTAASGECTPTDA